MAKIKTNFIKFTGIDLSDNEFSRPVGSLEKCINLIPEDMILSNADTGYTLYKTGGLIPRTIYSSVDATNTYHDGTNHYPAYMGKFFYNRLGSGLNAVTVDNDKKLRVDGVSALDLGSYFEDIYVEPVEFLNDVFIPVAGWNASANSSLIRVTKTPS